MKLSTNKILFLVTVIASGLWLWMASCSKSAEPGHEIWIKYTIDEHGNPLPLMCGDGEGNWWPARVDGDEVVCFASDREVSK